MDYVLDSREMKAFDSTTIQEFGVPSLVLMERAALSVVDETLRRWPDARSFLIVCGSGNNGGDGLAAARILFLKGYRVKIAFLGSEEKASGETKSQLFAVKKYGVPIVREIPEGEVCDVVVDSIFGIGLCRDIAGAYYAAIERMNAMQAGKVAVDICSGIGTDDGRVFGIAFRADLTVTFAFPKYGQLLYPGASYTGELIVADIGISARVLPDCEPEAMMVREEDLCLLPGRSAYSNKGTYGKVLVIAGSVNMAGAAYFSASAAYHTGAGLVRVLTPKENRTIIQTALPEAVLTTYDSAAPETERIADCLRWADVLVLGPGIGTGEASAQIVEYVLQHAKCPCIIDADALNLIARRGLPPVRGNRTWIFTPHLGEMARLTGKNMEEIREFLVRTAREFAAAHGIVLVLKDARTVTALPDGKLYINTSGNSGMATGGSGDVLTGVIAGLIAQGTKPDMAAPFGVYLHGLAGDAAAAAKGKRGMTASDLLDGIGDVLKERDEEG